MSTQVTQAVILAAGQGSVQDRNADFSDITRKLAFTHGRDVASHDYVVWFVRASATPGVVVTLTMVRLPVQVRRF